MKRTTSNNSLLAVVYIKFQNLSIFISTGTSFNNGFGTGGAAALTLKI